jgi:hypothetical protein
MTGREDLAQSKPESAKREFTGRFRVFVPVLDWAKRFCPDLRRKYRR